MSDNRRPPQSPGPTPADPNQRPPHPEPQASASAARPEPPPGPGTAVPGLGWIFPAAVSPAVAQQQFRLWQGQYPPPEAIERYEKVHPGSLARMISMAEELQKAQIDEVKRAHDYAHSDSKRGHWLGASIAFVAMGCAVWTAWLGYPWVAGVFIGVPVMSVARALVETVRRPSNALTTASSPPPGMTVPPSPPSQE